MTSYLTASRGLLIVGAVFVLLPLEVHAQQATQPAASQPPPPGLASAQIGRPADSAAAAKLAPVFAPPIPAAADKLPTAKLKLPPGFNIEVYASGMANARSIREGDKGTVFVSSRLVDKVYAIRKGRQT